MNRIVFPAAAAVVTALLMPGAPAADAATGPGAAIGKCQQDIPQCHTKD